MRGSGAVAILFLAGLAGCSDGADVQHSDLVIEPPDGGKGVIAGVVVDPAIAPVPDAVVTLQDGMETMTDEEGVFTFTDVAPGVHFLLVSKPGFKETQQSVEVVADVVDPPIVKVLLEVDAESIPYAQELVFTGFLECSTTYIALCGALEIVTETNDDFIAYHDLDGPDPAHIQSEMVWENTQSLSDRLGLWHGFGPGDDAFGGSFSDTTGTSPLLIETTGEEVQELRPDPLPDTWQLVIRVFSGDIEGTTPPVCVLFCNGPGVAINQEFEVFTHVFYNYVPPGSWRFTEGPVPEP